MAFTKSGVVLWGEFCGAQRVWTFAFRECIVFISSVGSFSIVVSSELKKETVFFEQQKVSNKHHRLVAVKYYTYLFTRVLNNNSWYTFLRALPFQRG